MTEIQNIKTYKKKEVKDKLLSNYQTMKLSNQKTIIITGGAGFIGSNFLSKYVLLFPETQFVNIDALTYAGDIEKISIIRV